MSMIRRGMRPSRPRIAVILAALALVGVALWPTLAEGAAKTFQSVIIRNTTADPVPVEEVSPSSTPVLRSGSLDILGTGSEPVPAGVVLTDLVVWSMNANCDVRLHHGDELAIRLAPTSDAADGVGAELHLQTGLPSTADRPLTLRLGGGPFCGNVAAFWSGYER
jgi:hypothetical protein